MAPALVSVTSGAYAQVNVFEAPLPNNATVLAGAVDSTDRNWLVALAAWRELPGQAANMTVCDNAHNLWLPCGDTTAAQDVQCTAWVAPAAQPTVTVGAAPTGYMLAARLIVLEFSGMGSWPGAMPAATATATGTTSVTVTTPAVTGPSLLVAVAVSDSSGAVTVSSGWTIEGSGGTGSGYATLSSASAWRASSTAQTVTFTGGSGNWAVLAAVIPLAAVPAQQENATWPAFQLQAGFGSGVGTPAGDVTWTDISNRFLAGSGGSFTRGIQYELNALQATTADLTLDNNDGALDPESTTSPFAGLVQVDVPERLLATWQGRCYSLLNGFVDRWPQGWEAGTRYGMSAAEVTDAWSAVTAPLSSLVQETILAAGPYAYWPGSDPAGSAYAQNLAPGNSNALMAVVSKNGAGAGTQSFGAASWVNTDQGATGWAQAGVTVNGTGWCLQCRDPQFPTASAQGYSVCCWYDVSSGAYINANIVLISVTGKAGLIWQLIASNPSLAGAGYLKLVTYNASTGAAATTTISTQDMLAVPQNASLIVTVKGTSWTVWAAGAQYSTPASGTGTGMDKQPVWVEYGGTANPFATGNELNGGMVHCAVFPRALNFSDSLSIYTAGSYGFANDHDFWRAERLLGFGGYNGPRLPSGTASHDYLMASPSTAGTLTGSAVSDVAASSGALLYVDGCGTIIYTQRSAQWNAAPQWLLGENAATILNANWSFNAGIAPWTPFGGTVSPAANPVFGGSNYAAVFTPDGTSSYGGLQSERFPVTALATYLTGAQLLSTVEPAIYVSLNWYNSAGVFISTASVTTVPLPPGGWAWVQVPGGGLTAPAGAAAGQVVIVQTGTPPSSHVFYAGQAMAWQAGLEVPYGPDISLGYDKSLLYNDAQVTPLNLNGQGLAVIQVTNDASIAQHGDIPYQYTSLLFDPNQVVDSANWIVNTQGTPQMRVEQVTVDAGANPLAVQFVLAVEVGDIIQVARRPPGVQPRILICQCIQVKKTIDFVAGTLQAQCTLSPFPAGAVLSADDPVYGQLTGTNLLAWLGKARSRPAEDVVDGLPGEAAVADDGLLADRAAVLDDGDRAGDGRSHVPHCLLYLLAGQPQLFPEAVQDLKGF